MNFKSSESLQEIKGNEGNFEADEYIPPDISTNLRTDVNASTSKQFWITVHIPNDVSPGVYVSNLTVSASNAEPKNVSLKVNVLPITLHEPKQWFLIYYAPFDGARRLNDELMEKQLVDIKDHGFKGLCVHSSAEELKKILNYSKKLGFEGPIITRSLYWDYKDDLREKISFLQDYGYEPYIYGQDEPNAYSCSTPHGSLRHHIQMSYDIHQTGGKVVTAILKSNSSSSSTGGYCGGGVPLFSRSFQYIFFFDLACFVSISSNLNHHSSP